MYGHFVYCRNELFISAIKNYKLRKETFRKLDVDKVQMYYSLNLLFWKLKIKIRGMPESSQKAFTFCSDHLNHRRIDFKYPVATLKQLCFSFHNRVIWKDVNIFFSLKKRIDRSNLRVMITVISVCYFIFLSIFLWFICIVVVNSQWQTISRYVYSFKYTFLYTGISWLSKEWT